MKTKNKFFLAIFIIIFLLMSIFIYIKLNSNKNKICFEKNCFNVEIASTQEKIEKGLMFKSSLNKNSGMLFIFPNEKFYNFWMKDTLIPLDIIWINSDKEIVFIKHNAQPCKEENCEIFTSNEKALYVLEINSGIAEKTGLEIGDLTEFEIK